MGSVVAGVRGARFCALLQHAGGGSHDVVDERIFPNATPANDGFMIASGKAVCHSDCGTAHRDNLQPEMAFLLPVCLFIA